MDKERIEIEQSFNAPVETIFNILTDHESFGNVISTVIKRVVDSSEANKNGVGSVRRISAFPFPSFEETVVTFIPNQLMEYKVSKGSPIKNHKGRMEFSDESGKTRLFYTIDFDPKLFFVFFCTFLKGAIDKPIRKGIKRLAEDYDS
jgi:polyketide cyclase/dehydrase/lipid transport protein